jgi:nucleolar GTP-binding protein
MNFQNLTKIEKADWYLDLAFRNAKKAADEIKSQKKAESDSIKKAELAKIREIRKTLFRHLELILNSFPSLDTLTEFYQELVRAMLDYEELKKSLGAMKWAEQKIENLTEQYHARIKRCREFRKMTEYSRAYYGRISSVIKQITKQLEYLEHSRKVMREFPSIKSGIYTVAIAGFPNAGKTTLLAKLTNSKPEIADYAFTTKKLNVGYAAIEGQKVQFIDTPGTLNRFEKMNAIEKQAYLAIKYCAEMIIFVFDVSETSYGEEKQKKLLKSLHNFGKDVVVYCSKTDLLGGTLKTPIKNTCCDIDSLKKNIQSKINMASF